MTPSSSPFAPERRSASRELGSRVWSTLKRPRLFASCFAIDSSAGATTVRNTGENTRVGAIDSACELTEQMLPNLEHAMDHPDMTEELANILSTNLVRLETDVRITDE